MKHSSKSIMLCSAALLISPFMLFPSDISGAVAAFAEETASAQEITLSPIKTEYLKYEAVSLEDYTLTAVQPDGTSAVITDSKPVYNFSKAGKQTVTVSYTWNDVQGEASYQVTVSEPFSGKGTEEDPYLIQNRDDLAQLANLVNHDCFTTYNMLYYKQTADIDLKNELWTPIGTFYSEAFPDKTVGNNAFNGVYDGDGHQVSNLCVQQEKNFAGLFGRINASTVIRKLSVNGSVSTKGTSAGGIAAEMGHSSKIEECCFNGSVQGTNFIGGIVGKSIAGGTVVHCYANAQISASGGNAGGITGTLITGNFEDCEDVLFQDCYFTGTVSGKNSGGILGMQVVQDVGPANIIFENCYYLSSSCKKAIGNSASDQIKALTEKELKSSAEQIMPDGLLSASSEGQNDGFPVFYWQKQLVSGDVTFDGQVTVSDAVLLLKYLHSAEPFTKAQWESADVNQDYNVNIYDWVALKRILLA